MPDAVLSTYNNLIKVATIILIFIDEETRAQKALIICTKANNVEMQ